MTLLEVENLVTELGEGDNWLRAVDNISLAVEPGQTYCLVGESGSGKSVTALSIMGLLPHGHYRHPDGHIRLTDPQGQLPEIALLNADDETLRSVRGSRIAMIFQEPMTSLNPVQTIGEQLEEVLLIHRPELAEILKLMRDLQTKYGMGMLFITHDFGVVAQIADVVGVMRKGKLVESGKTADVLRNPQHEYTQSLIAALPERLIRPDRPVKPEKVLLEVKDVSVYFPVRRGLMRRVVDHFRAVENVSLQVNAGEVVALVGESGCGKTTLGRALLRLQEVTSGSIFLEGQDITQVSAKAMRPLRRRMQVVFQDPGSSLNPRLPIHTTLIEPMRVHGIGSSDAERTQIAARFLDRVEMPTDSLWRYPHEFSGGQRQRLAIARALVLEPRFILCDEITSALDVSVQAGILRLLRQLVDEEGIGMLFITHNMGVVDYLADRMVVMHRAQLVESGNTQEIMKSPQNEHTKNLLDAVPRLDDNYLASAI